MREIRTSGLMSGDGKRGNATAPVLDSTRDLWHWKTDRDDRVEEPVTDCTARDQHAKRDQQAWSG